jgi:hypothetical protein
MTDTNEAVYNELQENILQEIIEKTKSNKLKWNNCGLYVHPAIGECMKYTSVNSFGLLTLYYSWNKERTYLIYNTIMLDGDDIWIDRLRRVVEDYCDDSSLIDNLKFILSSIQSV